MLPLPTQKGLSHRLRYALVAALAFSVGSTATVTAGPVVSGFVGLIDGENTAAINASRELSVADAIARGHLADINTVTAQLAFDGSGNLKTAPQGSQTVNGTVSVGNFPGTQSVTGTINVGNLPATQGVTGTVNVGNIPATQNVAGTVSVGNFPATQSVSGTVGLSPSANTVKIDPANNGRTFLALSEVGVTLPTTVGFGVLDRQIDVASYERIRVSAFNHSAGTCGGTPIIQIQIQSGFLLLDLVRLPVCDALRKVYEVPGTTLRIFAISEGGLPAIVDLQVFGR